MRFSLPTRSWTWSVLFCLLSVSSLSAALPGLGGEWTTARTYEATSLAEEHPFVAAVALLSPEPNQLRVQDLRGVECYPQPDNLQVCGEPDTACFLLFTKSEERLPEIEMTLRFGDGIEFSNFSDGGSAYIDYSDDAVFPPPLTDIDDISIQNPEAPSFLISGVTRDSGSVYICYGVRAECGADFARNPPNVTYEWRYTTASGISCEGEYTPPNDFGASVIVPRVRFTNTGTNPGNTNLGNPNEQACQTVEVTQTTLNASATGYILTATDYGFENGIMVDEITINGVALDAASIDIDPTTGFVTAMVDREADPLEFLEIDEVDICYTFTSCIPQENYSPLYTVVSACDGFFCTGPADPVVSQGSLIANFPGPADVEISFDQSMVPGGGQPNIPTDMPYVFDVVFETAGNVPLTDDLYNLRVFVQSCASSLLYLESIELVDNATNTVVGEFDESIRVISTNGPNAGQVDIRLFNNRTLSGGDLVDIDGDGAFDDVRAGGVVRLRITYAVVCTAEDQSNVLTVTPGSNMDCQITRIDARANSGCGFISERDVTTVTGQDNFATTSTSSFDSPDTFNGRTGYNFGVFGNAGTVGNCNPRPVATETINFTYNLTDNPLVQCPNDDGTVNFFYTFTTDPRLSEDVEFSNFGFDNTGDMVSDFGLGAGLDTNVLRPEPGTVILQVINTDASADVAMMDRTFIFDMSFDTAYCSPQQFAVSSGSIVLECASGATCALTQTAASTNLRFDPDDCGCDCYIEQEVIARRISTGFTDSTRTVRVDPADVDPADQTRIMAGDTVELTGIFFFRDDAAMSGRFATEALAADRIISFELELDPSDAFNFSVADNRPAILDYQLTRLQSFVLRRGGVETDIGAQFSGPTQSLAQTGQQIGLSGPVNDNFFPQDGEILQPGFPNGGFSFGSGDNSTDDEQDGARLQLVFRNIPGEVDAISTFRDAIGGNFMPGDSFIVTYTTVLIDNPGQIDPLPDGTPNPPLPVEVSSRFQVQTYSIPGDQTSPSIAAGEDGCPDIPAILDYYSPTVVSESRIEYDNECEANVRIVFRNDGLLPAGWYEDEFRPITGVETIELDIPAPYYYNGGATVDAFGAGPFAVEPDSSAMVDTASVNGIRAFAPNAAEGQLIFTDAEFADGVRSDGYDNFDFGNDDITTVGATFPLIAVGGAQDGTDSLVFNIPLRRLCGDEPITNPNLTATYNWANRHLPDYEDWPYRLNTNNTMRNFWVGKVRDNDGNDPGTDPGFNSAGGIANGIQFYFPFQRLPDADDPNDEINPLRRVDQTTTYDVIGQPEELVGTFTSSTITDGGTLTDAPGATETNSFTLTPGAGQTLAGTVFISVGDGGDLVSITSGGAPVTFEQAGTTDTTTLFAIAIPMGLAPDATFAFDLETDLLFCAASEICLTPVLGCGDDPALTAAAFAAFDPACNTAMFCYMYAGGQAMVTSTFDDPQSLDLCETQEFVVQYFNDGTSTISGFDPVLYVPEGLDASNFNAITTGGTFPLTDPTYDPAVFTSNFVFGEGRTFDPAELNAALGGDGFDPGEVLTITFDGRTSCDFTSGVPLVTLPLGEDACANEFEGDLAFSENIDVALPPGPQALISFDVDDQPLELSCSDDGDRLVITTANIGKGPTAEAEICVRLPDGITLDLDNVNVLAPAGLTFDAADVETTSINAGGATQQCFPAPVLEQGAFVCLEIPFIIGDVPCGEQFIGATIVNFVEVSCANAGPGDTNPCTIPVSTSEELYLPINVVPAVTANDATLSATCTNTPGIFNVEFGFDFLAESQPYSGEVVLSLYSDVDANGEFDDMIDTQIGAPQSIQVNVPQDVARAFSGVFPGVAQEDICPLLLVVESLGCECSSTVIPFPEVLPTFVDDLGDAVTLCPGEPFTFEGICADLFYSFDNPEAGTVTVDETTGEATITINDGFAVMAPEVLRVTGSFGSCGLDREILVSAPASLGFGPYEYTVCNNGRQEVDLNIPLSQQEDISVRFLQTNNILNPNSFEPVIEDLQADQVYDIEFSFNGGQCVDTTQLTVTVDQQPTATFMDITGCQSGFRLDDRVMVSDPTLEGSIQSDGDGEFTPDNDVPGTVFYTPGPLDIEAGFVNLRYNSDEIDGPCGPVTVRAVATIQIVNCGEFFWDGSND